MIRLKLFAAAAILGLSTAANATPVTNGAGGNGTWVTGEAWNCTHWNPGEPNDDYGPDSEYWLATWGTGIWKWDDEGALGDITGHLVERNAPVPEPGTLALLGLGLAGLAIVSRRKA